MKHANYKVIQYNDNFIVLKDIGPWDKFMTITNAAEEVVQEIQGLYTMKPHTRIVYLDSEGEPTELRLQFGKFVGFAPFTEKGVLP